MIILLTFLWFNKKYYYGLEMTVSFALVLHFKQETSCFEQNLVKFSLILDFSHLQKTFPKKCVYVFIIPLSFFFKLHIFFSVNGF